MLSFAWAEKEANGSVYYLMEDMKRFNDSIEEFEIHTSQGCYRIKFNFLFFPWKYLFSSVSSIIKYFEAFQ